MKSKALKKYTKMQKILFVLVPIITLLLIVSIVMCAVFSFLPLSNSSFLTTGNLTIVFASCSAVLAVFGLLFAFFSKSGEEDDEE